MWVLALFRSITLAGIAGIVIGIGFITAFPAWNALIVSLTTPERRGEVLGSVGLAQGMAAIVGASLGSLIYASDILSFPRLGVVNYNVPFWLSAILLTVGAVMAFTWMRSRHCHMDPGGGVTVKQMRTVVALAIVGFLALVGWIGYRYTQPVPPDRVAWQWVQQLFRGKPEKAVKFTISEASGGWDGAAASKHYSERFFEWKKKREGRYTVRFARVSDSRADVPVSFVLKGGVSRVEHVLLRRQPSGEWKVCGVFSEPESKSPQE
jgi:hypothetical protein